MANGSYIEFIICEVIMKKFNPAGVGQTPIALAGPEVNVWGIVVLFLQNETCLTSHGAMENAEIFFYLPGGRYGE